MICPGCERPAKLVEHHWFDISDNFEQEKATAIYCPHCNAPYVARPKPPNFELYENGYYHYKYICLPCNTLLQSYIWGLRNHILPNWETQKIYLDEYYHKRLIKMIADLNDIDPVDFK